MVSKIDIRSPKYGIMSVYFDEKDSDEIRKLNWQIAYVRGKRYAVSSHRVNGKKKQKKMHRLIMGVLGTPEIHIDHKDGDGLNNTRANLRVATTSQNVINTPPNSKNKTGYKGVSFNKKSGKYVAVLFCNGISYFGGYFVKPEAAAIKYNELAKKHFGDFAYLNKIK